MNVHLVLLLFLFLVWKEDVTLRVILGHKTASRVRGKDKGLRATNQRHSAPPLHSGQCHTSSVGTVLPLMWHAMGECLKPHLQRLIRCKARGEELQEVHIQEKGQCGTIFAEKGSLRSGSRLLDSASRQHKAACSPKQRREGPEGRKHHPLCLCNWTSSEEF